MDFVDIYDLERIEDNRYIGRNNVAFNWSIVYGGQIMSQAILAAHKTVDNSFYFHSLQVFFIRPGKLNETILYYIKNLRDGRTLLHRKVYAYQGNRLIAELVLTFCILDVVGIESQSEIMPEVLDSKDLLSFEQCFDGYLVSDDKARMLDDYERYFPFHTYHCDPSFKLDPNLPANARYYWFELKETYYNEKFKASALLAYLSDFHFLSCAYQDLTLKKGLDVATVSHCIYLHRKFKMTGKYLFYITAVTSSYGLSVVKGSIFNEKGDLMASLTQEGTTRYHD